MNSATNPPIVVHVPFLPMDDGTIGCFCAAPPFCEHYPIRGTNLFVHEPVVYRLANKGA